MWLYWRDTLPVQSNQLCSIGADMTSAKSLSLSIYNLLLYDADRLGKILSELKIYINLVVHICSYFICNSTVDPSLIFSHGIFLTVPTI